MCQVPAKSKYLCLHATLKHLEAIKLRSEEVWGHLVELTVSLAEKRETLFLAVFFLKYIMKLNTTVVIQV